LHPKYENQNIISNLKKICAICKINESRKIQHHKAHFASILGEKNSGKRKVLVYLGWNWFRNFYRNLGRRIFPFENLEKIMKTEPRSGENQ
jgi:hydrogenase maturation factor HypF (carbamoyltransferase family)